MANCKFELHFHTSEVSFCGKISAETGTRLIHAQGYAGIVVTDHYTPEYFARLRRLSWPEQVDRYLQGYRNALRIGKVLGMVVLPGMEIRFGENNNDYLVYGFDIDFLLTNPHMYKLGIERFSALASKYKLLVYQAHPFRDGMVRAETSLLHGIEGYNSHPHHNSRNGQAMEFARKNNLPVISGSDIHDQEQAGRSGVIFNVPVTDQPSLLKALRVNNYRMIIRKPESQI